MMGSTDNRGRHLLRRGGMVLALAAITACTPIIRNHGFVPSEAELSALQVGVDTRESVTAAFGPATSGGVLGGGAAYYVASKFRHYGPFAPEEIERQVLAISFNEADVVTNIELFGLQDGQVVALSRRVTDDGIRDTTFIRQLLGSFGRVDAGDFLGEG